MSAESKLVIAALNEARYMELKAIRQYMAQYYKLASEGLGQLADSLEYIAKTEMRHAQALALRIRDLGGVPTMQAQQLRDEDWSVREAFKIFLEAEQNTLSKYAELREICLAQKDVVSAELLTDILKSEQEHLNYFEDVLKHIETLGDSFLAQCAQTKFVPGD